jgi:hypothetical protein
VVDPQFEVTIINVVEIVLVVERDDERFLPVRQGVIERLAWFSRIGREARYRWL